MQTSKVMQEREKIKKKIQTELIKLLQPQVKVQLAPTTTATVPLRSAAPAPTTTATAPLRSAATATASVPPTPLISAALASVPPKPLISAAPAPLRSAAAPEPYSKKQEELYSLGQDMGFEKKVVDRILNEAGNDTEKATNLLLEYLQFGLPESKPPPSKPFQPTKSGLSAAATTYTRDELYAYATSLGINKEVIEHYLEDASGDVKKVMEFISPEHASTSFSLDPAPPQQITSVPLANEGGNFCYMNVAFQLMMSMSLFKTVIKNIDIQSILRDTRFIDVLEKLKFMSSYNILNMMVRQFENANFETLRYPDPKYYLVLSLLPTFVLRPVEQNMVKLTFGTNLQITKIDERRYKITFTLNKSNSDYIELLQQLSIGDDINISIDKGDQKQNNQWKLIEIPVVEQRDSNTYVTCIVEFKRANITLKSGESLRVILVFNYSHVDYVGSGVTARNKLIEIFNGLSESEQSKVFDGEELVHTPTDNPGKRKFLEVMNFLTTFCSSSSGQQDAFELYNSVVNAFCNVFPGLKEKIIPSSYILDSCSSTVKDIDRVLSDIRGEIPDSIVKSFSSRVDYGKFGKTRRQIEEKYLEIQSSLGSSITKEKALEAIKSYDTYMSLDELKRSRSTIDREITKEFGSRIPNIIKQKGEDKIFKIIKQPVEPTVMLTIEGGCGSMLSCFERLESDDELKSELYTPLCDGRILQSTFFVIGEQDNIVFGLGRNSGDDFNTRPITLDPILRLKKGDGSEVWFRLQSVICRSGSGSGGGHFIFVYFYYNSDGSITKIVYNDGQPPFIANESYVFYNFKGIDEILTHCATIVMYERIG